MESLKLVIVGPKNYTDYGHFKKVLSEYISNLQDAQVQIICLGTSNIDGLVCKYAQKNKIEVVIMKDMTIKKLIKSCTHLLALPSSKESSKVYAHVNLGKIYSKDVTVVSI